MHLLSTSCVCALLLTALLCQVTGLETVVGLYGETVEIPCNTGAVKAEDARIIKWKYDKGDGLSGDLLVKQRDQNVSISATDEYKGRVSMAANSNLLLSAAKLTDQRTFTCMVVSDSDIKENPVNVVIYKSPADDLEIYDHAQELEIGKLTKLGTCVAKDANPAANITWLKNNKPLVADGQGISIQSSVLVDPVTKLSTTTSTLEYSAEKEDMHAQFTCSTQHTVGAELVSPPVTLTITYSTENIVLQVSAPDPLVEGGDLTLKCVADGNPAPTSFYFHLKGQLIKVENGNTYTIKNVSRNTTGEYKCSLIDNPSMESSKEDITVNYLDINLSPSGNIVKRAGDALELSPNIESSGVSKESWTKDGKKLDKKPDFNKLVYMDSGSYEWEVTMGPLSRKSSFTLVVEGAPVIQKLSIEPSKDGQQVLTCQAEGSPKPTVSWSINGTLLDETPFENGKITHSITVVPSANLTVSCTVSNEFGVDTQAINVSSLYEEVRMDKRDPSNDADQTKVVVGVVVGLLIATLVLGLAYWVYMKKSKQGSWKTGEKENGSSEEEKKLEEKVEENSQKAEV